MLKLVFAVGSSVRAEPTPGARRSKGHLPMQDAWVWKVVLPSAIAGACCYLAEMPVSHGIMSLVLSGLRVAMAEQTSFCSMQLAVISCAAHCRLA
jgi:hypothetical protein